MARTTAQGSDGALVTIIATRRAGNGTRRSGLVMRQAKNKKYVGIRKTHASRTVLIAPSGLVQLPCPEASHHNQNQAPAATVARTRTRNVNSCRSDTAGTRIDLVVTGAGLSATAAGARKSCTLVYRHSLL